MKEPMLAPAGEEGRKLPSLTPGEVFASRYRVEKALGQGLYGHVYLVKHTKYGQSMVLKLFYPALLASEDARRNFKSEFDRIKAVRDPGVAKYFDQGEAGDSALRYVTLEYLNGSSLRSLMDDLKKQGKQFSALDAVEILIRLLETLKTVHTAGVSHRNIKPENVLIVTRGRASEKVQWDVRLSDFALTRAPIDWMTEVASEKLPYLAPEIQGYGGQVGPRSDVYSVGALLYEMLTGAPPDASMTPISVKRPSLPKKFDDIIELTLAQNPSERYASVQDLLAELQDLPAILPFEQESAPKSRLAPLLILLGLSVLLGVITFIFTREPVIPPESTGPALWEHLRLQVRSEKEFVTETAEQLAAHRSSAPPGMVYIPAGSFIKGALPGEPDAGQNEPKATQVQMPGYYIDQYEFPNKAGDKPQTRISWEEAEQACNRLGRRLCTAEEWERACKGEEQLIYSYGDAFDPGKCPPIGITGAPAVDASPECRSSYKVFNVSGGVSEWVNAAPAGRPERRMTKGGLVGREQQGTRCAAINDENVTLSDPNLGFRCCK